MTKEEYENEIENQIKDIKTMGFKKMALSPEDVAVILNANISTLYNWRKKAIGPAFVQEEGGKRNKVIYTPRAIATYLVSKQRKMA